MVTDEAKRVEELLRTSELDPITRITKYEFERKFLPMLAMVGEDFPIEEWIVEVSHPHVRLHVYGDDGNVLYDIPPFLAPQKTVKVDEFRISDQTDTIKSLESDNPRMAMEFVGNMLRSFNDESFNTDESANEMATVLNKIFSDYNMPLLGGGQSTSAAQQDNQLYSKNQNTLDNSAPILDFEPL